MSHINPVVTLDEVCDVLACLEPRAEALTYWQVRRQVVALGVIDPQCAQVNHGCSTRFFDPEDVMLLRVYVRLRESHIGPQWVPSAIVAAHRSSLVAAFGRPDLLLVVRGITGAIVSRTDATAQVRRFRGGCTVVSLSSVATGVVDVMRDVRRQQPDVWDGTKFTAPSTVAMVPSSLAVCV